MLDKSPRSAYGTGSSGSFGEKALDLIRRALRRSNSPLLGWIARKVDSIARVYRPKYLPLQARVVISLCQPIDPLRHKRKLPAIDLVVPFVEKDLDSLALVLNHAELNVRNPIERIILITPRSAEGTGPRFSKQNSQQMLSDILEAHPSAQLKFDQDILGAPILAELEKRFGAGDRNAGWVTQQLIKLSAALQCTGTASLILDADTVLLSRKTWLAQEGVQLLQVANEYHIDFMRHVEKFFGVSKTLRLSYVTHHQLMQRDVIREMFPTGAESLLAWWKSSNDPIGRDLGDYEAYGSFVAEKYPKRVKFGSFANLFSPQLTKFLGQIKAGRTPAEVIPGYCSVSFHSWAQVDRFERSTHDPRA